MNCIWIQQNLHRVLDRDVSSTEATELQSHLTGCERCRQRMRAAAAEEQGLKAALRPTPPPMGFASCVMARLSPVEARPSRRIRLWIPLSAAAALLLAALPAWRHLVRVEQATFERPGVAMLSGSKGGVMRMSPGRDEWERAEPGVALRLGDKLRTDKGSQADVRFGDRAKVKLDGETVMQVGGHGVLLESGRVFAWVDKADSAFAVGTRHAMASVLGTRFGVNCRPGDSTVLSVVDGVVLFGNDLGHVEVPANMQSTAVAAEKPQAALYADLAHEVAWAGIGEEALGFPVDVRIRARPEGGDGAPLEFAVDLDYGETRYADLRLVCEVVDAARQRVARQVEQVCTRFYRYRTRKVSMSSLPPGSYHARFRIGYGRDAVIETLDVVVK